MREEFRQPSEFYTISEFHHVETAQEFHAPSEEYDAQNEEGITGRIGPAKPVKVSLLRKMRKVLYLVSASVFVTAATQAVYPDFVVFSAPFSVNQEQSAPESPGYGNPSAQGPSAGDDEVSRPSSDPEQRSEIWIDCPNCEDGFVVCPVCNGDWEHGAVEVVDLDCENCEDGIVLKRQQIFIYNGTPCKFCNDTGTFVDPNGATAECGECRGYASRHQVGEKQIFEYYNEFYRQYAFDESVEYVEEPCPECGGRGVRSEAVEVPCKECDHGSVECPVCEGEAGHYEDAATEEE